MTAIRMSAWLVCLDLGRLEETEQRLRETRTSRLTAWEIIAPSGGAFSGCTPLPYGAACRCSKRPRLSASDADRMRARATPWELPTA